MLTLPPGVQLYVATMLVDGRKGIDGLANVVRHAFGADPLSGAMFVFFSKRRDRVRVLYWDRDGYVLITKRLEVGRYRLTYAEDAHTPVQVEAAELLLLLEGIDISQAKRRARWVPGAVQS